VRVNRTCRVKKFGEPQGNFMSGSTMTATAAYVAASAPMYCNLVSLDSPRILDSADPTCHVLCDIRDMDPCVDTYAIWALE